MSEEKHVGTVLKFQGFGFIIPDGGGGLVYFRSYAVAGVPRVLAAGDRVEYGELERSKKGLKALAVRKIA